MISPRAREPIPLILNMPHLVSPLTKVVSGIVTVLFWSFFSYLWIPLLMLIAGLLGYHTQDEVRYAQEAINFRQLTFSYVLIVFALGGSLLMWALQEYLRFRHSTRRRRPLPVELSDLALYTKMEESDLAEWQSTRRMVAYHDADGGVLEFNTDNDANLMRA